MGTLLREIACSNVVHRFTPRRAVTEEACPLTDRELEILRYVATGYTNGRIARELWVTEQTVKFHLSNTYRKLGVSNRTEASRYAHLHDLLEPPAATALAA
jgi:DNA-binding NarL/FixJ family response regulator